MAQAVEKFDASKEYTRHPKAYSKGGVQLKEEEGSTVNTRAIVLGLIKSVGGKLKEGNILDLLKISRPAIISFPRTYLECIATDLVYTEFLNKAAATSDVIQRMKYVVAFFMASLHRNSTEMGSNGPLNPVLGETFFAEKSDGTKIYCEQVTHHPPVSAYYMVHPEGAYKLHGTGEVAARMGGLNTINGQRIGRTVIEFKDGGVISIENPEMRIDGLMMGDRTVNYVKAFNFIDKTNKIIAQVEFNFEEIATLTKISTGIKSFFGKGPAKVEKPLWDTFSVEIFSTGKDRETNEVIKTVLCTGSGSWLSHLEIDNKVLWKVTEPVEEGWIEDDNKKLKSDSKYRNDSLYIKQKNYDRAQKEKDLLENVQRQDAKSRKSHIQAEKKTKKPVSGKALG